MNNNNNTLFRKQIQLIGLYNIYITIACYTKYVSNEEMYRDEQFSRLSRSTYSFIYVINEFTLF
jgi:hypothetical protein